MKEGIMSVRRISVLPAIIRGTKKSAKSRKWAAIFGNLRGIGRNSKLQQLGRNVRANIKSGRAGEGLHTFKQRIKVKAIKGLIRHPEIVGLAATGVFLGGQYAANKFESSLIKKINKKKTRNKKPTRPKRRVKRV